MKIPQLSNGMKVFAAFIALGAIYTGIEISVYGVYTGILVIVHNLISFFENPLYDALIFTALALLGLVIWFLLSNDWHVFS